MYNRICIPSQNMTAASKQFRTYLLAILLEVSIVSHRAKRPEGKEVTCHLLMLFNLFSLPEL